MLKGSVVEVVEGTVVMVAMKVTNQVVTERILARLLLLRRWRGLGVRVRRLLLLRRWRGLGVRVGRLLLLRRGRGLGSE